MSGFTNKADKGIANVTLRRTAKDYLYFPIAPGSYEYEEARNIEIVSIHGIGDITLAGNGKALEQTLELRLPNDKRPYMRGGTKAAPQYYLTKLKKWMEMGAVLKLYIGKRVCDYVLLSSIGISESGMTRDVIVTLQMRRYSAPKTVTQTVKDVSKITTVTVKKGDSLGGICKKYYGDSSLKDLLMRYNKLKSVSAVKKGVKIKVPPRKAL